MKKILTILLFMTLGALFTECRATDKDVGKTNYEFVVTDDIGITIQGVELTVFNYNQSVVMVVERPQLNYALISISEQNKEFLYKQNPGIAHMNYTYNSRKNSNDNCQKYQFGKPSIRSFRQHIILI